MLNLNCKIKISETTKELHPTGKVYQFTHVKNISIQSSYKNFTDTAVITMPKAVVTNKFNDTLGIGEEINKVFPVLKEVSINEILKQDYFIEVFLGYDNDYKPAFRGYIREVKGDAPVEIICDDMMYYLKKHKMAPLSKAKENGDEKSNTSEIKTDAEVKEAEINPIPENSSYTVQNSKEALIKRFKEIEIPFEYEDIKIEDIGEIVIDRKDNIVEFLQELRQRFDVYSYFNLVEEPEGVFKSKLYITNNPCAYKVDDINSVLDKYKNVEAKKPLPKRILNQAISNLGLDNVLDLFETSKTYIGDATFRFHYNIISDTLKVINEEVKSLRVRAEEYYVNSNIAIAAEVGDTKGKLLKRYIFHNNTELIDFDDPVACKKKQEEVKGKLEIISGLRLAKLKQTGLTGAVTTFGEPFMRPLDKVYLDNAEEVEKEGLFQIEEVQRTYGVGGYRQVLTLGRVLEKE